MSWFHKKIFLFLNGRKETFKKLQIIKKTDTIIWFHCASLGEFEQGRPIIEAFKRFEDRRQKTEDTQDIKIILTFFSPSGYEVRKDYEFADVICYLPLDTQKNVRKFIAMAHPNLAIFIKYEFWPNILKELNKNSIQTLLVSGIFRKKQAFFTNGLLSSFMRKSLKTFDHFFVQDENSKKLLNSINLDNVTISGDTRFDRVFEITKQNNQLHFIEKFTQEKHILVAGSTWKKDEELIVNYINNQATSKEKFIIAPHNIKDIANLKNSISKKVILYSERNTLHLNDFIEAQVFIIDTIGILTKIYSYANVAYVGGGFGSGIHNILEPATFGVPIIIGPNYQKFKEATDLVASKGCFVINNTNELATLLKKFTTNTAFKNSTSAITKKYINSSIGATNSILDYIKKNSSILQARNLTN